MAALTAPQETAPAPTADRRRWWALVAVGLSTLVIGFDGTILNVALPTLSTQLGATTTQLQWIVDGYLVVFASAMLPAGLLGDRFGRRRLLLVGLVLFGAASLAGTFVGSPDALIAVRAAMGLGGALIMPLGIAVIPALFPSGERSRAVAVLTAGMALGMPLGPLLGGLLLQHFWWGSIFLVNVPLIAIGALACLLLMPESKDPSVPRVDPVSTVLGVAGLGALTFGIIQGPVDGWGDPLVLGMLAAAVLLLGGLVLRERSQPNPMVDFTLLGNRTYRWATISTVLISFTMMGGLFVLSPYLQSVLGYDALATGLRLMPMMLGLIVAARICEPLVRRAGYRVVIPGGLLLSAAGILLGATTSAGDGYGRTAVWLSVLGVGLGFTMIPAMSAALGTLSTAQAGVGSGLLNTLRQASGAIGVALLGSMLTGGYRNRLAVDGLPGPLARTARGSVSAADAVAHRLHDRALTASAHAAYIHGMDLVLLVCGSAAVLAALLCALRMGANADAAARTVESQTGDPGQSSA
jgi:EmrB/QacA subfamily drug resistance transporter